MGKHELEILAAIASHAKRYQDTGGYGGNNEVAFGNGMSGDRPFGGR